MPPGRRRHKKLVTHHSNNILLLLDQRPTQHIGPARRHPGKILANLQYVFLIHHQTKRTAQASFQRWIGVNHRLQPLITTRKPKFLLLVGRTRTDDADNGNQTVYLPHGSLAAKADHRRRFNVMHRPPASPSNHRPHSLILPRLQRSQIHIDPARRQRRPRIPHHRQPALRQNVKLDQTNRFHPVHVKMRDRPAVASRKRRRQTMHRLARKHHPARVHLRMTRHPIKKSRHPKRRPTRLLIQQQISTLRTPFQPSRQPSARILRRLHLPAPKGPWKMLRQPPHVALRHSQYLGHLSKSTASPKRGKSTHHRPMNRPMTSQNQRHHVVLSIMRKIHINVRQLVQRHPLAVQKSPEIEVKPNRTHITNTQTITNQ